MRHSHTITGTGNVTGAVPDNHPLGLAQVSVYGVEVRVASGTVTSLLTYIAEGKLETDGPTVKDSAIVFEASAAVTTGLTADGEASVVSERWADEEVNGCTPYIDVLGSGAWELEVTVLAREHNVERT